MKNNNGSFYIETYGCQMNFSDSEIIASVLNEAGFKNTENHHDADIIFINTCAIRDNAEQKARNRLKEFRAVKKHRKDLIIGVLGCMAERLKEQFLEEEDLVDLVVGPDAYRDLPNLIFTVNEGKKAVNVLLSREETYADINPVRLSSNGVTAFISIMRGCDNMCSFCVVPFTRGRERSRDPQTIAKEASGLFDNGYREITLLGQNVDSYLWSGGGLKKDFKKLTAQEKNDSVNFAQLLELVSSVNPLLRIRFSTSHPKDMTDEVLQVISRNENICNYIHLPVQSGSSGILKQMNRGYSRDWYRSRIEAIRKHIPDCGISTDIISGFCNEKDHDHKETLSLMDLVKYDFAYMFKYSERPGTKAERMFKDNVSDNIKLKRLNEIIQLQQKHSLKRNKESIGKTYEVLVEGISRKSADSLFGRNTRNTVIVFPRKSYVPGEYVKVKVTDCTAATLIGFAV